MILHHFEEVGLADDAPLWHYLHRYHSRGAEALLDQLRGLTDLLSKADAVVPIEAGPFRLQSSAERFEAGGLDREGLLKALGRGLDVVSIGEPTREGWGPTIAGIVDDGQAQWFVRLGLVLDDATPGDWRLFRVGRRRPEGLAFELHADWRPGDRPLAASEAQPIARFLEERAASAEASEHRARAALEAWRPGTIAPGPIGLHVPRSLQARDEMADRVARHLLDGEGEVYVLNILENRMAGSSPGLSIWLPDLGVIARLYPPMFPDAGPDDLLLVDVTMADGFDLPPLARFEAEWCRGTVVGPADSTWREEVEALGLARDAVELEAGSPEACDAGPFRIHAKGRFAEDLAMTGLGLAGLCEALSKDGTEAVLIEDPDRGPSLHVRPEGSDWWFGLGPWTSRVGRGDWRLVVVQPLTASEPEIARVRASWRDREAAPASTDDGDGAALVDELRVIQAPRLQTVADLKAVQKAIDAEPPGLDGFIKKLRRINELEKEGEDIGLVDFRRADGEADADGRVAFLLTPGDEDKVRRWIDDAIEYRPEGVDWVTQPLKLEFDGRYEKVNLGVDQAALPAEAEVTLKVFAARPEGVAALDRLATRWQTAAIEELPTTAAGPTEPGRPERPGVRLYLPNPGLDKIERAIDWLDPVEEVKQRSRPPMNRDHLQIGPLALQRLRQILTDAEKLEGPAPLPVPDLPLEPLEQLSEAQRRAVAMAVHGPDMLLIHGPAGAGKTSVILETLRQLFHVHGKSRGFKVLLVAPTHVAVDNVLERLLIPRDGQENLAGELGVTPYRLGPTKRIARHLQGFAHDCFHSNYLDDLEARVADDLAGWVGGFDLDRKILGALDRGLRADVEGWSAVLDSGAWPEMPPWRWPRGLPDEWRDAVRSQAGRVRLWRSRAEMRTEKPSERIDLLRDWLRFMVENRELMNQLLVTSANLVCATTIGCATVPGIRSARYSHVIVDEAGKEEIRKLLVPLIRGDHWVLVGDPKQLPPFVDRKLKKQLQDEGIDETILTRSLFEELEPSLKGRGRYVFLNRQGRMHPDISAFVSEAFYRGELEDFPKARERILPAPSWLPDSPTLQVLDTRGLPNRWDRGIEKGFVNDVECALALRLLQAFVAHPAWEGRTLGVIAPYKHQAQRIEAKAAEVPSLRELMGGGGLQVGTVDSFQGQERDLIVFSCTRSNIRGNLKFVDDLQRLNVALTRAKARLLVLADGETIERSASRPDEDDEAESENRRGLIALLEYARRTRGLVRVPTDWRRAWA